jgi:hypothetical protein
MCRAHPAPPRFLFTGTPAIHSEVEGRRSVAVFQPLPTLCISWNHC